MDNIQQGKQKVLKGAEALFMRYGIKSVTMDDVSRELGMSKKTLYQYVENKADLIRQVILEHIREEKEAMAEIRATAVDAIDEILKIARYVLEVLRQTSPNVIYDLRKYYRESWRLMEDLHREYVYEVIKANIHRGVEQGLYRPGLDPDIIARLYVGKTMIVVDEEFFPPDQYRKEHLFAAYMEYHIRGVASQKGLQRLAEWQSREEN